LSSEFVNVTESAHKVLGQGNFVLTMGEGLFDGKPTAFYDLYRLEEGKQVGHWDVWKDAPSSGGEEFQWQVLDRTCRNRVFLNEPVWENPNPHPSPVGYTDYPFLKLEPAGIAVGRGTEQTHS